MNNDELADALQGRLDHLFRIPNKWTPEILSLLLELSDRPAQKSKIEDLDVLKPVNPAPSLTWSDILAEDPLDNQDGLWDNVNFTGNSSDEDVDLDPPTPAQSTPETATEPENVMSFVDRTILPPNDSDLETIIKAQFWQKPGSSPKSDSGNDSSVSAILITEGQMIREVMFMLLDLPTLIFIQNQDSKILPDSRYNIRHTSEASIKNLLGCFAMLGERLSIIRQWALRVETVPLVQTFQSALATRLGMIDRIFSTIQARFLDPPKRMKTTLISLLDEVCSLTQITLQLSEILTRLKLATKEELPFKILESLYESTSCNQSIGYLEGYNDMAKLFFECLHTYLKPIRLWMEGGELNELDRVFFVIKNFEETALESLWQKHFALKVDIAGVLHAPKFLHVAVKKIFTTGKSVYFLTCLGQDTIETTLLSAQEPRLDFQSVCQPEDPDLLSPFPELFDLALDRWIVSKYHSSSVLLRNQLESKSGLWKSLDALENVYLSRNGFLSAMVASTIFDRIDREIISWNDGFVLTELFREVFGSLRCVHSECLVVRSTTGSSQDSQSTRRSVKVLSSVQVSYSLPWAVSNIIKKDSIKTYQRISIFLMQVQRAKQILERRRIPKSALPESGGEDRIKCSMYSLRHRLLWFTNVTAAYLMDVVLSASTADMRIKMAKAEDVDEMIAVHETYVLHLEEQSLISKRLAPIHQAILSILNLAIVFSDANASHLGETKLNPTTQPIAFNGRHHDSQYRRRDKNEDLSDDDDSDSGDDDEKLETNHDSPTASSLEEQLKKMHETFISLHAFVTAGLRGVSRAGGESCWEILADKLAWSSGKFGNHRSTGG